MSAPIRVFIGTDETQRVPCAVLKHSITSRTQALVEFHELDGHYADIPKQYTGFSFNRWAIPMLCGYEGRAIYLDADIVCLCDIAELFNLPMHNYTHLCRPVQTGGYYTSVMLMDCGRLQHWDFNNWAKLADNRDTYKKTMWALPGGLSTAGIGALEPHWNSMDQSGRFDVPASVAKFFHYTVVPNQPWKKAGHPDEGVWRQAAIRATEAGAYHAVK